LEENVPNQAEAERRDVAYDGGEPRGCGCIYIVLELLFWAFVIFYILSTER
jgi:hypothetical protein